MGGQGGPPMGGPGGPPMGGPRGPPPGMGPPPGQSPQRSVRYVTDTFTICYKGAFSFTPNIRSKLK